MSKEQEAQGQEKEQKDNITVEVELANAIKALQDKQAEYDEKLKAIEKRNVEAIRAIISGRTVDLPTEEKQEEEEEQDPEAVLLKNLRKKYKLED